MSARGRVAATVALGLLVFAAALTPAVDADLWWHLAAGREMLARRWFLFVDPFTLSAAGRPWIDVHWLFQLLVYGLHQWHGLAAVVLGKATIVTAGALVLLAFVERGSANRAGGAAAAVGLFVVAMPTGLFFVRHLILVRPVVITLLFLALFLLILEGVARGDRPRRLLWLPVLQLLWVNSQGLFALGPALIACYAAGAAVRQWRPGPTANDEPGANLRPLLGTGALVLASCLVTPYGIAGFLLPIKLLLRLVPGDGNVFSANIAENVPPWLQERSVPGQMAPFFAALGLTGASFVVARHRLVVARGLLVALFALLALLANRNVLLFFWMAIPIAVLNLAPSVVALGAGLAARAGAVTGRRLSRGLLGTALAGVTVLLAAAHAGETSIAEPAPFRVPAAAAARLAAAAPPAGAGRIFAADHYGGYLIWALYPRYRPYLDTRLVLHTGDEYTEFLGLLDNPERWDAFAGKQNFDHVLLPAAFPDRYLGLIRHLVESPDWRLTFTDGTEVLFTSSAAVTVEAAFDPGDPAQIAAVLGDLDRRLPLRSEPGRAARRHLARLLSLLGHPDRARDVVATLPPDDLEGQLLRARSFLQQGDVAAAQQIALACLDRAPRQPAIFNLLAATALARGEIGVALGHLRRALALAPFDPEARGRLDQLETEQRRTGAAQRAQSE